MSVLDRYIWEANEARQDMLLRVLLNAGMYPSQAQLMLNNWKMHGWKAIPTKYQNAILKAIVTI